MKRTLLIDVDGTLAEFVEFTEGQIGPPLKNAKKMMGYLSKYFRIVIFTVRPKEVTEAWLKKWDIPYDDYIQKPMSFLILDDRALRFNGDWEQTKEEIFNFKPWSKTKNVDNVFTTPKEV